LNPDLKKLLNITNDGEQFYIESVLGAGGQATENGSSSPTSKKEELLMGKQDITTMSK
jgi:hypothetical protein